ncbi:hypothetical protein Poli38472_009462 [Pythium oligandrum]|uniref:Uncharacterized protein n=1 Tax=Pythium oligandrum TaxID=41045 RepID=A0A8K1CF98_PYTOL|nr:hypothetical protein Poli38472_009462 [Pythium oligandrum]|eukprot:TMW61969.1 hypothetical protein Poli38472_009462 [Pythium oligandrum]
MAHREQAAAVTPLRVVITDDHHHVLPEIHLAIRQRRLPFTGLHIVHFDAHPDLSFSKSIDPSMIYDPEQLYDLLDESESGIAEFLLPLLYAGHVNRLTWIKSPWAEQMRVGSMERVAIGQHQLSKRLAVSCPWLHFVEDGLYASESELEPATFKHWDFSVCELSRDSGDSFVRAGEPWILDVDLDYFSTWNPFRKVLEKYCSPEEMELLVAVFTSSRFKDIDLPLDISQRQHEHRAFADAMQRIRDERLFEKPEAEETRAIIASLRALFDQALRPDELLSRFLLLIASKNDEARDKIWSAGPSLDLPHHESSSTELQRLLEDFDGFVRREVSRVGPPKLVTIAKSAADQFTPPHHVEIILSAVLKTIEIVCGAVEIERIEYEPIEE